MSEILEVQGKYYIQANASIADVATRVLKQADTFGIFDRHGDIRPLGFEHHGVFHQGTRFLSRWKLALNGTSPLLLSSSVKEDNDFLVVDMANPVLQLSEERVIPQGSIHLVRMIFLLDGNFFERIEISSFALQPVMMELRLTYQADYVDLFEVRGTERKQHGRALRPEISPEEVTFAYEGLDGSTRRTRIHFSVPAAEVKEDRAVFHVDLEPQQHKRFDLRVSCLIDREAVPEQTFQGAFSRVHEGYEDYRERISQIETSNPQFNDWIYQSRADLHMLETMTPHGLYPYAGIPWFSCIFGRDGIITAFETLWVQPEIARGVLSYLASRQASEVKPEQDAEPGKILHEERKGEMVALGEVPFGCYYGSIDSTPLWLILAGHYYQRTADRDFIEGLWPHVERALAWIDSYGDSDGDGFVEYRKRASGGLANQGWKDSEDSVFHKDGSLPAPPIALCEVQAYVYEARLCAAYLAEVLGKNEQGTELRRSAERLKTRFHEAFWCEQIQSYAIALDGSKKPCGIRSSNAGHCLFSGIAHPHAAARIKEGLLDETFFSGWGIRTISTLEARYNPMSYHNGSVWPHDNALIAYGLARYGFKSGTVRVLNALFDASQFMDSNRLPELYCGFPRRRGEGPTLYPVACNPQAWSSASIYLVLQACLGLHIDAVHKRICFQNPCLPEAIRDLRIRELKVDGGSVDLSLVRHEKDIALSVTRRSGDVELIVTN